MGSSAFRFRHLGVAGLAFVASACAITSPRYQQLSADLAAGPGRAAPVELGDAPLFVDGPLRLDELVQAVLDRNPDLDAARAAWQAALARYPQEAALPDPMVSYSIAPLSIASSDVRFGQTVEISQSLPWPGKRRLAGELAVAEAAMARADVAEVRLRLAASAAQLYYDYYAATRALEIVADDVRLLEDEARLVEARLGVGQAWQDDALAIDLEVADRRRVSIELGSRRDVAAQAINALLHLRPELPLPPPPVALAAPGAPVGSLDDAEAAALVARPELAVLAARADGAAAAVAIADKDQYPDLRLMGTYTTMFPMLEHQIMVGVGVSLPVWRDRRHAAVDGARAQARRVAADRAGAEATIRAEVAEAWRRDAEARDLATLYRDQILPTAEARIDALVSRLPSARADVIEIVRARRTVEQARLAHLQVVADAWRRRAELDRARGDLPTAPPLTDEGDRHE
ncbi:MAG: TolC family protein [Kofleriaceae bacterium]|nr:TolC family protein [Kofleriaceae bacterium]